VPPLRLAFYRGAGLSAWAIRTVTWSAYDHVALLLPDGSVLDVEPGAGVSEHAATRTPDAVCTVDAPDVVLAEALAWARGQTGKPYDWLADLGVLLHRDWRAEGAWQCSEMATHAFEVAGRPLLNAAHVNRVTPGMLAMSPMLAPGP